jgi:hypothetical protein
MADLITLEDYKTYKGLSSFSEDAKITPLLSSVTQLVKTYCGRTFIDYYSTDLTEYFNNTWLVEFIQLKESPVVAITGVYERASTTDSYVALVAFTDYYLDTATDCIHRVNSSGTGYTTFAQGPGAIKVVYKGGFATCPLDLKMAVMDLVTYYLKEDYKTSRSLGSASMNTSAPVGKLGGAGSAAMPDHIKRVLDLYRFF